MISGAEADRIGRALESVADWTGEIVVVLNEEVSDGTDRIAVSYGAKVFREPWKGHIAQKNSAVEKATQEWILGLDADEVVSLGLREEIQRTFQSRSKLELFAAFSFPRLTRYGGRWIRHGDWYPDRKTRLWRNGLAEWGGIDPHDKLKVSGATGRLRNHLLHYTAENIDRQVAKIPAFCNDFVKHAQVTNRKAGWWDLAFRPAWRFVRCYFLRLGFLDGWQGYYIACMVAFQTATRYAKLREAQLPKQKPGNGRGAPPSSPHP
jgi:glycosyltransferase involved in cell wall biosynthesis